MTARHTRGYDLYCELSTIEDELGVGEETTPVILKLQGVGGSLLSIHGSTFSLPFFIIFLEFVIFLKMLHTMSCALTDKVIDSNMLLHKTWKKKLRYAKIYFLI